MNEKAVKKLDETHQISLQSAYYKERTTNQKKKFYKTLQMVTQRAIKPVIVHNNADSNKIVS